MPKIKLRLVGGPDVYRPWRTENPTEELWKSLLLFADSRYLRDKWKEAGASDITVVSTALRQAHEFRLASRTASLLTRPLLVYYSFLNLTKAVLHVVNDSPPNPHHGLRGFGVGSDLGEIFANSSGGVFFDLATRLGTGVANRRFTFDGFARNAVDLHYQYIDYYGKLANFVVPEVTLYNDGTLTLTFSLGERSEDEFMSLLQTRTTLLEDFEVNKEQGVENQVELRTSVAADNIRRAGAVLMSKHFEYSVFPDNKHYLNLLPIAERLPQPLSYFGMLFLLGSVVRYEPAFVATRFESSETGLRWFINEVVDVSQRVYPNLVLDILTGERQKFEMSF